MHAHKCVARAAAPQTRFGCEEPDAFLDEPDAGRDEPNALSPHGSLDSPPEGTNDERQWEDGRAGASVDFLAALDFWVGGARSFSPLVRRSLATSST
mmetsp:Transcript_17081/g.43875  ORF Transcript_17081/g.43875 Transcript_17081/m.43875 type:complete len:97 (+) Transcript_17081:466-756(+)